MSDEIEELVQRVEAENAAMEAKLAARERDRLAGEARAKAECAALKRRLAALEPELEFTTEYVALLKKGAMVPSPRRVRRQAVHLVIRAAQCGAAAAGAALLYDSGFSEVAVAAALVAPGVAVWVGGDLCDALEIRHG